MKCIRRGRAAGLPVTQINNGEDPDKNVAEPSQTPENTAAPSVSSALRDKLQVLPVCVEQLKAVIQQTDEAASGLSEAFMGINRRAKNQLQAVQNVFGSLTEANSGANILTTTQASLDEIRKNFSMLTAFFDELAAKAAEMTAHLAQVDEFAGNLRKIGQTTNILALNAAIEAARVGDAGAGFSIIAKQVKDLANDSSHSINEISDLTLSLNSNISAIQTKVASVRGQALRIGEDTDEMFNRTIHSLGTTLDDTAAKMQDISRDCSGLSKEIGKAVVSIQFQDITRQRIEHVIEPLRGLEAEMVKILDQGETASECRGASADSDAPTGILGSYTMESEREIYKKVTRHSAQ
jgi:methyl-accepting chemotaxis protein